LLLCRRAAALLPRCCSAAALLLCCRAAALPPRCCSVAVVDAEQVCRGSFAQSGDASDAFAQELQTAMQMGVHVLLAHEMPNVAEDGKRGGVVFDAFFDNVLGTTPHHLVLDGVYNEIAVRLGRRAHVATWPNAAAHDS
jgi:hypothetical protein